MRADDLIVGQRYKIKQLDKWATYAGRHDGKLVAADGTAFYGADKSLRFFIERDDGEKVLILAENGARVEASEEAIKARQAEAERREAAEQAAIAKAVDIVRKVGLLGPDDDPYASYKGWPWIAKYNRTEDFRAVQLHDFTIGTLIDLLESRGEDVTGDADDLPETPPALPER